MARLAYALVLTTLLLPGLARADKPDVDKREEARKHYGIAVKYYNMGDFDRAIPEYKAAYELTSEPGLLFNIAQSYRLKKDPDQALFFYRAYLRAAPQAENRADVEQLITELEQITSSPDRSRPNATGPKVEAPKVEPKAPPRPPARATPPPVVAHAPAPAPAAPPIVDNPPRPGRTYKIAGAATAGAGAVLVGITVWLLSSTASASDTITTMSQQNQVWTAEDQSLWDRSEMRDKLAVGTALVGGAAVVGGVILYVVGMRRDREAERRLSVVPTPGGAAMVFSCAF